MSDPLNVCHVRLWSESMSKKCAVSLCKCQTTKGTFGIRIEQMTKKIDNRDVSVWETTWAYKIKNEVDTKNAEPTFNQDMEGNFLISDSYPGCPYCGKKKLVVCGECNHIFCADEGQSTVTCPWDNKVLNGARSVINTLRGGKDR